MIDGHMSISADKLFTIAPDTFMHPPMRKQTTPEKCVKRGGHCWERDPMVTASSPPVYTECCKHCPAWRRGKPREAMEWTYPDGQP